MPRQRCCGKCLRPTATVQRDQEYKRLGTATLSEAVDLVIFIDEDQDLKSGRKVREILLVTGYRDGRYQVEQV